MTLPQREPHLKYRYLTVLRYFMDVIFRRWPSRRGGQSYCLTSLPLPWPPLFPPPSSQSAQMGLQVGRGPAAMPGLAAKPATSEEPRTRVELAQEAVERQQKLVEMGVEAKRIIELGVEDLSSRNLLKFFEIADANIEVRISCRYLGTNLSKSCVRIILFSSTGMVELKRNIVQK